MPLFLFNTHPVSSSYLLSYFGAQTVLCQLYPPVSPYIIQQSLTTDIHDESVGGYINYSTASEAETSGFYALVVAPSLCGASQCQTSEQERE